MTEPSRLDVQGPAGPPPPPPGVIEPRIRADLAQSTLVVPPGEAAEAVVRVTNNSEVIERIKVRLLGLIAESSRVSPRELTLFPGESGEITVELHFHDRLPRGTHQGMFSVVGSSGSLVPAELPLTIEVPPSPGVRLAAEPPVRTAGKKARFDLDLVNTGNTPLDLQVRAADADRVLSLQLATTKLGLAVEQSETVALVARKRRHWTGAPIEHIITIDVEGDDVAESTEVRFRQKARLTAGVITLLTLALILTLWALAMYYGVQFALDPADPQKIVPASFSTGVGLADLDPATAGGAVSGAVLASTTAQPVARVIVEAFDQRGNLVAATATGEDGAFELDSLLPVRHRLRIRAPGFVEQWWQGAADAQSATPVLVSAAEPTEGLNVLLVGNPGALGGQVIAGDGDPVPITVEVVALDLLEGSGARTTVSNEQGIWRIDGLVAPATYRVTYRAPGYAPVELTQPLGGGQELVVNTARLPAADGAISGFVLDRAGDPVGGVAVTAQSGDLVVEATTPTAGLVGSFTLPDLTTPGTYLLSFAAEGFAPETRAVRLGPGETVEGIEVVLSPALGIVTGRALDSDGVPLGAVRVTVSGGGTLLATETLTSGDVGSFRVAGVPLPGVYAVTFEAEGYRSETVQVSLSKLSPEARAEARLQPALGAIAGLVVDDATGQPVGAVRIEVSDGSITRTTTTASAPASATGRFQIGQLQPGSYTITATASDGSTVTVLRTVRAGETAEVELRLGGSP